MVIAVTFALPAESSEFLRRLRNKSRADRNGVGIIRGNIDDRELQILHTGVGEKVCRERLGNFFQDQQFELLISAGFAGALNEELRVGDLFLAKNFSTFDLNERRSLLSSLPIRIGDLLTVPALIDSSEDRNKIALESGAAAVDMETTFIARACAAHALPLLSIRVISDTPRNLFPAPPDVRFDVERQQTRIVKLAKYFVAHPNRAPRLVLFARRIAHARKTLAKALIALINKL